MEFYCKVVLLVVTIAAVLVCRVQSRSSGPPANEPANRLRVCNDMLPSHPGDPAAQSGNGGYTISTDLPRISDTEYAYTADQTYTRECMHAYRRLVACGSTTYSSHVRILDSLISGSIKFILFWLDLKFMFNRRGPMVLYATKIIWCFPLNSDCQW